jgi:hypothetical protein
MTFLMAQANFEPTFSSINTLTILKSSYSSYLPAYEDRTDRVFRNVGIQNSDAGELPRRKSTTFTTRRKFKIKNTDKTKYMVTSGDQNTGRSHDIKIDSSSFERVERFKHLEL